jgi:hypothetical protein
LGEECSVVVPLAPAVDIEGDERKECLEGAEDGRCEGAVACPGAEEKIGAVVEGGEDQRGISWPWPQI